MLLVRTEEPIVRKPARTTINSPCLTCSIPLGALTMACIVTSLSVSREPAAGAKNCEKSRSYPVFILRSPKGLLPQRTSSPHGTSQPQEVQGSLAVGLNWAPSLFHVDPRLVSLSDS